MDGSSKKAAFTALVGSHKGNLILAAIEIQAEIKSCLCSMRSTIKRSEPGNPRLMGQKAYSRFRYA